MPQEENVPPKVPHTPSENTLLVEYKQAQQSAEHHDRLLWTVSSLILAGMASLLGFVLRISDPPKKDWRVAVGAFAGLLLCYLLYFFMESFAKYRNQKYNRCKVIEGLLGMKAHSETPQQYQRHTAKVFIAAFAITWLFLLYRSLCW